MAQKILFLIKTVFNLLKKVHKMNFDLTSFKIVAEINYFCLIDVARRISFTSNSKYLIAQTTN